MDQFPLGVKVLVVDDIPASLQILFQHLSQVGCHILVAQNGDEALSLLQETIPDIILMDIMIPGKDGFMICQEIKKNPKTQDIPVLFVSALNDAKHKVKAFHAGGVDYITKPCQPEEVVARIQTHLHIQKSYQKLVQQIQLLQQEIQSYQQTGQPSKQGPTIFPHSIQHHAHQQQEASHETSKSKQQEATQWYSQHILLVEDNLMNQRVILALLQHLHLTADVVSHAQAAMEILGKQHYDLVLMDIQLPQISGIVLTRMIRDPQSSVLNHQIPIVALTANAFPEEQYLAAGMNGYIPKPVQLDLLQQVIEQTITLDKKHDVSPTERHEPTHCASVEVQIPTFDYQGFLKRLGGDVGICQSILSDVPNDLNQQLFKLSQLWKENKIEEFIIQAHTIKGIAANISALSLMQISSQLELAAKQNQIEKIPDLLQQIHLANHQFLSILTEYLNNPTRI